MSRPDRLALALDAGELPLPASGRIAVLRAAPSPFLDALPRDRLACEQSFRPLHDALAAAGHPVAVGLDGAAAMVVINVTRARGETLGEVARGLGMLPVGGVLAINGAKTDGIDSLARRVAAVIRPEGAFVKAHGRVAWFRRPARLPPEVEAWAAAARPSRTREGFLTVPGLFSPEGPDPGSLLLAESFAGRLSGRVADLGAGWGWLAHAALAAAPGITAIDLHEAEARALELARANVPDARAAFHWSDAARLGPESGPYDAVIINPPFHAGRAAEPGIGAAFIAAAGRILAPRGRLLMVANRQLPYEAALGATFADWRQLAGNASYKVLLGERPRRD